MGAGGADGESSGPPIRRRGRVVAYAAVAATIALIIGLMARQVTADDRGRALPSAIAQGDRPIAPDFELARLDEEGTLRLSALRGNAVVLNFWASWCDPCKDEAPLLQAAWERYRDDGVVVLGVDSEDLTSDAKAFMRRYGLTFPNVRDGEGSVKGKFGLIGYPETFFLDPAGRLAFHVPGAIDADTLEQGIQAARAS